MADQEIEKLTDKERQKAVIAEKLRILAERRERKEISETDFPDEGIYSINESDGRPLRRSDLRFRQDGLEQAIVITHDRLSAMGGIIYISNKGKEVFFDPDITGCDPEDIYIFLPEEFGETIA